MVIEKKKKLLKILYPAILAFTIFCFVLFSVSDLTENRQKSKQNFFSQLSLRSYDNSNRLNQGEKFSAARNQVSQ